MKTKKVIKKRKATKPPGPVYVRLKDVQLNNQCFIGALNRAIEFHRTNTNDPHNIGTAVMVALSEVRDAFIAYIW